MTDLIAPPVGYACSACGLRYSSTFVMPGDGYSTCDCVRCPDCKSDPGECVCEDEDLDDDDAQDMQREWAWAGSDAF